MEESEKENVACQSIRAKLVSLQQEKEGIVAEKEGIIANYDEKIETLSKAMAVYVDESK